MPALDELIPRPPIVRERLVGSLRDARLLHRLLRLSVAAAEEGHQDKTQFTPHGPMAGKMGNDTS